MSQTVLVPCLLGLGLILSPSSALPPKKLSTTRRLCWVVYSLFSVSFGVLLGAVSPTIDSIAYVLSTCWSLFAGLSWAIVFCPSASLRLNSYSHLDN